MNVQLMTHDAFFNQAAVNARAGKVASAFLNDRWPDIICFNEVLDEEARGILVDRLSSEWPHVAKRWEPTRTIDITDKYNLLLSLAGSIPIGHPLYGLAPAIVIPQLASLFELPDDPGLMVFSRYKIMGIDFVSFNNYDDDDRYADKGVAYLKIERSADCVVNLFVTHMQAGYNSVDQYRDIREEQLKQIESAVTSKTDPDLPALRQVTMVAGDLNIHGDREPRQEWHDIFRNGSKVPFFSSDMWDAWEQFISPSETQLTDPGITNRWGAKEWESRLDYVLLRRPDKVIDPKRKPFVVHRMFQVHAGVSDHIGVAAEINTESLYCCPAQAKSMSPLRKGQFPANLDNGEMAWLRFTGRGTWSLTVDEFTLCDVYTPDNMTDHLRPRYMTQLDNIPEAADAWDSRVGMSLPPKAYTYAIPAEEFYVRVHRRDDKPGPVTFGFYRHMGTSPEDAVYLQPQQKPLEPDFAALAEVINPPMEFWWKLTISRAQSGLAHESRFQLHNQTDRHLKMRLIENANRPDERTWGSEGTDQPILNMSLVHAGELSLHLVINQVQVDQKPFGVSWQTAMNYLISPATIPIRLICKSETGISDDIGSDEIRLEMQLDSTGPWIELIRQDDVDSNEEIMISAPPTGALRSTETGFVKHVTFKITEEDTVVDDAVTESMAGLPTDVYESSSEVTLEPGLGEYLVRATIRREPFLTREEP